MKLKQSLIIALSLSITGLIGWEMYWRSKDKVPTIQDNNALWAVQRNKVNKLTDQDFVFIGSSRIHFDLQLDVWEKQTGKKPIQLAMGGASPLPVFRDIVRNTNFSGTVVVGITPPLFFSTTFPKAPPISGPQEKVDYYKNRTYAQRFNHWLSMPLQRNFVLVHSYEDMLAGNFDLKSLLETVKVGDRTGQPEMPPFYEFGESSEARNVRMMDRMIKDSAFAQSVINIWMFCLKGNANLPPPDKEATSAFFLEDAEIFKKRGGKIILLRAPSSNDFREVEAQITPRKMFWDEFVKKSGLPSYHFEDYDQLQNLHLPEWSHLSATDADFFTKEFIAILKRDNLLTAYKNSNIR